MSNTIFTASEIEVIKRFLDWIAEARDDEEGVTGYSDEGVTFSAWGTEYSYGDTFLERTESTVPWIAFTDPAEYDRQLKVAAEAEEAKRQERIAAAQMQREAQERATLEMLRQKYG